MKYHTTKDGSKIKLSDLTLYHLKNIIHLIEKKSVEGLVVRYGGYNYINPDECWYDEDVLFGEEALEELNYYDYKTELQKRLTEKK